MKAHESYLKQSVVEITGKIGNDGDRVLQTGGDQLRLLRPLRPGGAAGARADRFAQDGQRWRRGEIKSFRLAFDNIPESWNQAMPQLVIARIDFT